MDYVGSIRIVPQLPSNIARLKDLAYNFYFSWNPGVRDLFIEIDRHLWKSVNHNPVKFLQEVPQKRLQEVARDLQYLNKYEAVLKEFDAYLKAEKTWFNQNYPEYANKTIAYFTAEFGFHESLPIYAGGLGVLAGDHMKSASDLGLPIVGVSLMYYQTYFTQEIDASGNQIANYYDLNPEELPLTLIRENDGTPLLVKVPLANREVFIQIWEAKIGRVSAFLLDTNIPQNQPSDRLITSRLYGGDQEMRISQEIVLGMGGVIALKAMNIHPSAWHMNEGHSVFLTLQRIKDFVQQNKLSFNEALEAVVSDTIFTTHTPVPAGNDAFPLHIKDKYFQKYWESVGIRRHQFMELGSHIQPEGYEIFNLTILSLNLSRHRNAVSKLHRDVSQRLWKTVWPDIPSQEVPIDYITNGVHLPTWTARKTREILNQYLKDEWRIRQDDPGTWEKVRNIPNDELWKTKLGLKEKMLRHIRERLEQQYLRNKVGTLQMLRINQLLKPEVLTIGFARRFATYKRGTLIFRNLDRLKRILNNPNYPVQLIFAGKAHPKDTGGQDLIRQIYHLSLTPELRGKIVFVENYDMGLARDLVAGVDVWLNNPRRTQEASGTSGQKVGMNAGINFSVLDGWWCEGYNGKNGWAFGDKEDFPSLEDLDSWDSEELYDILENDIIPLYYHRDEKNIPNEWIEIMKNSLQSVSFFFNTQRMVKEYFHKMYQPAIRMGEAYRENNFSVAREMAEWKEKIESHWSDVAIKKVGNSSGSNSVITFNYGESWQVEAEVYLGALDPSDVKVQVYLHREDHGDERETQFEIYDMELSGKTENGTHHYRAEIKPANSGKYKYTLRVLPYNTHLANPVEIGMAKWYQKSEAM